VNSIHIIAGNLDKATPIEDIMELEKALVNAKNVTMKIYNEGHCSFIVGTNNSY
jgi:dienelactone hydrolase